MSTALNCQDCGALLIDSGALEGRCPRCLLDLAVDESQAAVSRTPEISALSRNSSDFRPALILGGRRREPRGGFDGRALQRFEAAMRGSIVLLLAITVFLLGGLLMSASRAGFAASIAGVLALALLLMRGRWRERPDLVRWFWIGMASCRERV